MTENNPSTVIEDINKYRALESLKDSEGGRILIASLKENIENVSKLLSVSYKSKTHAELMGLCAELESNFYLITALDNSSTNKKLAEDYLKHIDQS